MTMAEKKEQLKLTKARLKTLNERIGKNIINYFQKKNPKSVEENPKPREMSEQQQIEEILLEANAYGLKYEVMETATKILKDEGDDISELSAYVIAYHEWIK